MFSTLLSALKFVQCCHDVRRRFLIMWREKHTFQVMEYHYKEIGFKISIEIFFVFCGKFYLHTYNYRICKHFFIFYKK